MNIIVIYRNSLGELSIQTSEATSLETENALNAFLEIENEYKNYPGEKENYPGENKRRSFELLGLNKKTKNSVSINSITFKTNEEN